MTATVARRMVTISTMPRAFNGTRNAISRLLTVFLETKITRAGPPERHRWSPAPT
jgi:hypothetical protein